MGNVTVGPSATPPIEHEDLPAEDDSMAGSPSELQYQEEILSAPWKQQGEATQTESLRPAKNSELHNKKKEASPDLDVQAARAPKAPRREYEKGSLGAPWENPQNRATDLC